MLNHPPVSSPGCPVCPAPHHDTTREIPLNLSFLQTRDIGNTCTGDMGNRQQVRVGLGAYVLAGIGGRGGADEESNILSVNAGGC